MKSTVLTFSKCRQTTGDKRFMAKWSKFIPRTQSKRVKKGGQRSNSSGGNYQNLRRFIIIFFFFFSYRMPAFSHRKGEKRLDEMAEIEDQTWIYSIVTEKFENPSQILLEGESIINPALKAEGETGYSRRDRKLTAVLQIRIDRENTQELTLCTMQDSE